MRDLGKLFVVLGCAWLATFAVAFIWLGFEEIARRMRWPLAFVRARHARRLTMRQVDRLLESQAAVRDFVLADRPGTCVLCRGTGIPGGCPVCDKGADL